MFNLFKKKNNKEFDFKNINRDNVDDYINNGKLQLIYLISPDFGGSEGKDNQIITTLKAKNEKQIIDSELVSFLQSGKSVKNFNCNLEYDGSIVPKKIIITAIVDGNDYKKVIEVW